MADVFIDSNLWVYAFIETKKNEEKRKRRKTVLLLEAGEMNLPAIEIDKNEIASK